MIGPKVLDEAKEMIGQLLEENLDDIDKAFLKSEKGLRMNLVVKLSPDGPNVQLMEVKLSFVSSRIKAEACRHVSEGQEPLRGMEQVRRAVERLRPKKGSGIDKVTISSPQTGESVSLSPRE